MGLLKYLYERDLTGGGDKRITIPTWSQTANGTPYVSASEEIMDPATAYVHSKVEQAIDNHGNLQWRKQYNYWTGSATPVLARTYTYTYVTASNYTNLSIFNRLLMVTVQKLGGSVITLRTNTFDGTALTGLGSTPRQWDSTVSSYRANLTRSVTPGGVKNATYFTTGALSGSSDDSGHSASVSTSSATNYAEPSAITLGSLTSSFSWNGFLGLTQATGPNSSTSSYSYDSYGRPAQTNNITGQVLNTTYTNSPPTETTTTGTRWTKTTFDGLARHLKVETGYNTGSTPTTVFVVDTVYTPCACTPIGKTLKVSLPHAPGAGTIYWTEFVYDAIGRTIQVKQPNSSGTAVSSYLGNTVTSADAAGKWKTYESDALGNLTKVTEPNPAGGANLETTYTYSEVNQLLNVSMPRGGVTQTRTFVYSATTQRLTTVTNPENGTTNHYYNGDGTLAYKIDAKNQKISYDYDSLGRLIAVHRFPANSSTEDTTQLTNFQYDGNSVASGFSLNVAGRLGVATSRVSGTSGLTTFHEMYSYDSAGRVLKKRLRVSRNGVDVDSDIEYTFNAELLNTMQYSSVPMTYYYDSLRRPIRMTGPDGNGNTVDLVNNVTYNIAGRMTGYSSRNPNNYGNFDNHTFTYNERNELTQQKSMLAYNAGTLADIEYEHSATADNGQILSRKNNVTAEKVAYQYDALKRLTLATATHTGNGSTNWASTYTHDGFGNLLAKTPTAGSAPNLSVTVSGTTNQITSGGFSYDANGNMTSSGTFDIENRLKTAIGEEYGYLTDNKRIYKRDANGNEWIYLHDASGKRLVQYQIFTGGSGISLGAATTNVYFGSRPIYLNDAPVVLDRLGSVVNGGKDYFPYGEEKTVTANPAEKFASYMRDSTGLDYANQRYFASATGRFLSPDPLASSADIADPLSLNRYSYVKADPVGQVDPGGLNACGAEYSFDACFGFGGPMWHGYMEWESPYGCWLSINTFSGSAVNDLMFGPCGGFVMPGTALYMAAMEADRIAATNEARKKYTDKCYEELIAPILDATKRANDRVKEKAQVDREAAATALALGIASAQTQTLIKKTYALAIVIIAYGAAMDRIAKNEKIDYAYNNAELLLAGAKILQDCIAKGNAKYPK